MNAYTLVGPTKRYPCDFNCFANDGGSIEVVRGNPCQELGRRVLVEPDRQVGASRGQRLDYARRGRAAEWPVPDRQHAAIRPRGTPCLLYRAVDLGERPPRPLEQSGSGWCQLDTPGRSNDERDPKLTLEVADSTRQRRLRHVQTLCGAAEVELLRDGDEVPQLPQFDRYIHSCGY
jgi:hypothetical protein